MTRLPFITFISFAVAGLLFSACEKDKKTADPEPSPEPVVTPPPASGEKAALKVRFNNEVDGEALVLGKNYQNPNGEQYSVKKFNYYISNIVLTKSDDTKYKVDLYQIIRQSVDTSRTMTLKGIPAGTYKSVKLMLGVDSASNCSGAHSGGLDFVYASDMFWSWNQGYIFLKLEGNAPKSPSEEFIFHLGGFGGIYKTQREFNLGFNEALSLSASSTPTLNLLVNVNEAFKNGSTLLSFEEWNSIMTPGTKESKAIADNYADMIKFSSISK